MVDQLVWLMLREEPKGNQNISQEASKTCMQMQGPHNPSVGLVEDMMSNLNLGILNDLNLSVAITPMLSHREYTWVSKHHYFLYPQRKFMRLVPLAFLDVREFMF